MLRFTTSSSVLWLRAKAKPPPRIKISRRTFSQPTSEASGLPPPAAPATAGAVPRNIEADKAAMRDANEKMRAYYTNRPPLAKIINSKRKLKAEREQYMLAFVGM